MGRELYQYIEWSPIQNMKLQLLQQKKTGQRFLKDQEWMKQNSLMTNPLLGISNQMSDWNPIYTQLISYIRTLERMREDSCKSIQNFWMTSIYLH